MRFARNAYLTLCVAVLLGAAYLFVAWEPHPVSWKSSPIVVAGTFVMFLMNALAFPSGLLWEFIFQELRGLLPGRPWDELTRATQAATLFIYWGMHAVVGYVQWFAILPRLLRRTPAAAGRIALGVMATAVAGVVFIAWILPAGYNNYTVRSRLVVTILAMSRGKSSLESACARGSFGSIRQAADIDVPEADPKSHIAKAELLRMTPGVVRLRVTLSDIYGEPYFLLLPRKAIPQGRIIEFEHTCSADGRLSSRFVGSTVDREYLPPTLEGAGKSL